MLSPRARRRGAARWLRLALAVLAVLAGEVSSVRAALGATCPRTGRVGAVAARRPAAAAPTPSAVARVTSPRDPPRDLPATPAACAATVAVLPPTVDLPTARAARRAVMPAGKPEAGPLGPAPPPPFHPPRAI